MARVTHGTVQHLIEWPGLLPEERAGGAVLPCVATTVGDVALWSAAFSGGPDQRTEPT